MKDSSSKDSIFVGLVLGLLIMAGSVSAVGFSTYVVYQDGPCSGGFSYSGAGGLLSAVNAAGSGDTIYVCPGTYTGGFSVTTAVGLKIIGYTATGVATVEIVPDGTPVISVTVNDVEIQNLTIDGNGHPDSGINIAGVDGGLIKNNIITENSPGIKLEDTLNIVIENNAIRDNVGVATGIELVNSNFTNITDNTLSNNGNYEITLNNSSSNLIYNNLFNNTANFYFYGTVYSNSWNTAKTAGTNIVGGSYLGGNFWANPSGTGFSETCTPDPDGFCDSSYTLASNNVDYLPLSLYTMVSSATGRGTVGLTSGSGSFSNISSESVATYPSDGRPPQNNFPYGVFSFNITGLTPGETVTVTLVLPGNLHESAQYWKYNASTASWYQIPIGSNDGDNVITITLTDGGTGDSDGTQNGVINDPGGPSLPEAQVPALTSLGILALAGLGGAIGVKRVRKKTG